MGHPSRETGGCRILGFKFERGTAGRLTIQTLAPDDKEERVAEKGRTLP
jgi:hypothetical protein